MNALSNFLIKIDETSNEFEKTFVIGPLPRGYGDTLGIVLRRILLSSIPGYGITGIKIDGIMHEFSTLNGVSDDILRIVLSLKQVVVKLKTLDKQNLYIEVNGKDNSAIPVKAGDFQQNANVEIVNPEYVITYISGSKNKFKAEVVVERGVGYKSATVEGRSEIGFIPLDVDFSPVTMVAYNVSKTRVGQDTNYDQLNITVKTNGSITSFEALTIAIDILKDTSNYMYTLCESLMSGNELAVKLNSESKTTKDKLNADSERSNSISVQSSSKKATHRSQGNLLIKDLNLSTRLFNALSKAGFTDLYEFEGLAEEEIANIKGLGSKSLEELLDVLKQHSIKII